MRRKSDGDAERPANSRKPEPPARGTIQTGERGGLAFTEIKGHLDEDLAQLLRDEVHRCTGRRAIFHDWHELTGYDPAARQILSSMLDDGRARFEVTHILLGSSLTGMGISIAATLLGQQVRCHTSRESWLAARAQAAQKGG